MMILINKININNNERIYEEHIHPPTVLTPFHEVDDSNSPTRSKSADTTPFRQHPIT